MELSLQQLLGVLELYMCYFPINKVAYTLVSFRSCLLEFASNADQPETTTRQATTLNFFRNSNAVKMHYKV